MTNDEKSSAFEKLIRLQFGLVQRQINIADCRAFARGCAAFGFTVVGGGHVVERLWGAESESIAKNLRNGIARHRKIEIESGRTVESVDADIPDVVYSNEKGKRGRKADRNAQPNAEVLAILNQVTNL